ncbi:uncharacterized protein LOC141498583 [Macrotis lagotis]|uniref:uncharacterized protein LOC141498583 n=1 Tax=Macrotis lagotis TaxID=92651 RepID=UPI003D6981F2
MRSILLFSHPCFTPGGGIDPSRPGNHAPRPLSLTCPCSLTFGDQQQLTVRQPAPAFTPVWTRLISPTPSPLSASKDPPEAGPPRGGLSASEARYSGGRSQGLISQQPLQSPGPQFPLRSQREEELSEFILPRQQSLVRPVSLAAAAGLTGVVRARVLWAVCQLTPSTVTARTLHQSERANAPTGTHTRLSLIGPSAHAGQSWCNMALSRPGAVAFSYLGAPRDSPSSGRESRGQTPRVMPAPPWVDKEPVGLLHLFNYDRGPDTSFLLYPGENVISRITQFTVVLPFPSISRLHAVIEIPPERGAPVLRDCNSLNGTYLFRPHRRLRPQVNYQLRDGDLVLFADLLCKYHHLNAPLLPVPQEKLLVPVGERALLQGTLLDEDSNKERVHLEKDQHPIHGDGSHDTGAHGSESLPCVKSTHLSAEANSVPEWVPGGGQMEPPIVKLNSQDSSHLDLQNAPCLVRVNYNREGSFCSEQSEPSGAPHNDFCIVTHEACPSPPWTSLHLQPGSSRKAAFSSRRDTEKRNEEIQAQCMKNDMENQVIQIETPRIAPEWGKREMGTLKRKTLANEAKRSKRKCVSPGAHREIPERGQIWIAGREKQKIIPERNIVKGCGKTKTEKKGMERQITDEDTFEFWAPGKRTQAQAMETKAPRKTLQQEAEGQLSEEYDQEEEALQGFPRNPQILSDSRHQRGLHDRKVLPHVDVSMDPFCPHSSDVPILAPKAAVPEASPPEWSSRITQSGKRRTYNPFYFSSSPAPQPSPVFGRGKGRGTVRPRGRGRGRASQQGIIRAPNMECLLPQDSRGKSESSFQNQTQKPFSFSSVPATHLAPQFILNDLPIMGNPQIPFLQSWKWGPPITTPEASASLTAESPAPGASWNPWVGTVCMTGSTGKAQPEFQGWNQAPTSKEPFSCLTKRGRGRPRKQAASRKEEDKPNDFKANAQAPVRVADIAVRGKPRRGVGRPRLSEEEKALRLERRIGRKSRGFLCSSQVEAEGEHTVMALDGSLVSSVPEASDVVTD